MSECPHPLRERIAEALLASWAPQEANDREQTFGVLADAVIAELGLRRWYMPDLVYEELATDVQMQVCDWPDLYVVNAPNSRSSGGAS